jgi:quercetin dioxygenase-like cupin family protein
MPTAAKHSLAWTLAVLLVAAFAAPAGAQNQPTATMGDIDVDSTMMLTNNASIQWTDLKVEGFNPGAKMAVIHGNPGGTSDYTVRLQFPDGYRFPVHWHPKAEHVTVLSGTFLLGMGTTVNTAMEKAYGAGDFLYLPAKNTHFGGAKGPTVIQLHGIGPFAINLGAPPK